MTFHIGFFKDRFKFSSAHFTLFPDGSCEKLHGHNYRLQVELQSDELTMGLACPFHLVKPLIEEVVGTLDEMILIPAQSQWVQTQRHEEQMVVRVATPQCKKWYSFPAEEVRALPFDNASSENLAVFVFNALKDAFSQANLPLTVHRVCVTESSGQEVWYAPTP